jgi:hypothetical protein
MGMFSRLFGPQMKYDDSVEKLVPSAHILAVSSFTKFLDSHSELKNVDPKEWDFFVTVAGISVGLTGLSEKVRNTTEYNRLTKILSAKIVKWNKQGELALSDLVTVMTRYREEMMRLPPDEFTKMWAAVIGAWCLANLKLEVPREQPSKLMTELGMLLIVSFHDWWSSK